ncbi:CHAD domain-containing protein, partial [Pontiella sp.]|uniref:CHAD domain-containing protein n=1 Tax=Pontiella sp. TaxID=2837462 RepID=UPI00356877E4
MLPDDLSLFKSGGIKPPQLVKHLPPGFSVVQNQETLLQGKLRDTFDGCCRRAGVVLLQQKNRVSWIHLKSGRMEEQAVSGDWSFAGELKGGPVGFQCLELSGLRAFSDLEALEVRSAEWAVTDELEKTVVRFRSIHLRRGPKQASWIFLQPLRGYDDDALRVFQALEKYGFRRGGTDYFPLIGLDAPLYEAKPPMDLRAASPAIETAGRIIENCIVTARRNEPGILDDIDTEFLHDYRVCLRRARSVLSLFRGVYAAGFCDAAKQQLADVMKQTNRLRDLDVYLLDRHAYYDMVPESQFGGLDIMFGIFEAERGEALEGVRAAITQPDYERGLDNLLANFQTLEKKNHGPAAQDPTGVFAKRLILKRYGKIASIAAVID